MELVYLWVEKYKNIHHQEFNFSPRFRCEFKAEYEIDADGHEKLKDDCELVIEENVDEKGDKQYIGNFFGDNINVTAIVGKNGSGKSSLVTFLEEIDFYSGTAFSKYDQLPFIVCLEAEDKTIVLTSIENLQCPSSVRMEYVEKQQEYDTKEEDYLFYKYCDFLTLSSEHPYRTDARKMLHAQDKTISYDPKKIANLAIKFADNQNYAFELTTFMMYPKRIMVNDNHEYMQLLINEIQPIEAVYSNNPKNGSPYPPCYDDIKSFTPENSLQAYILSIIVQHELCEYFFEIYDPGNIAKSLKEFYNDTEYELNEYGYDLLEYEELLSKVVFDIASLSQEDKNLFMKYDQFIEYDFEDIKGRKFSDLSHGEKSIYAQFVSIFPHVMNATEGVLIVLDEPDLSLHPNWQKKYLFEYMNTFGKYKVSQHLIFTTHSPFVLSDIPKQNIIFLDTDEEGKCKVVDGLKEKKETFGANIHTLLSDSFFMADGLMGEFAKSRIEGMIEFLRQENFLQRSESITLNSSELTLEKVENLISVIGEPLLQVRLKKMLIDYKKRHDLFTESDIEQQIEELRAQLREMRRDG